MIRRLLRALTLLLPSALAGQIPPGWAARWIAPDAGKSNEWMVFRKDITLASLPRMIPARVSADTKYWLYVNGSLVVFEGGLKGGPDRDAIYYDELDLAPYLRIGDNTLAVLVWHYGKSGESHRSRGSNAGALLMEIDSVGASPLVTDSTWRAMVHPGYRDDPGGTQPNARLAESNIYYDGRFAAPIDGWQSPAFDDSRWPHARDRGAAGSDPWGRLERRATPRLRFTEMLPYVSTSSRVARGKRTYIGHLPSNLQVTPYIRVDAPAGVSIAMSTDRYMDGGQPNVRSTYVTRAGVQEFESLGWMSGTTVLYDVPLSVRVLGIGYRESGYAAGFAGSFTSGDAFFDQLWEKAARTVYVNMRDSYMDCPTRERAPWSADAVNEMRAGAFVFDTAAYSLGSKAIRELAAWRRPSGELSSPAPSGVPVPELPQQMLASIWGAWQFHLISGDSTWMPAVYDAFETELKLWGSPTDTASFVPHRSGEWDWADWGDNIDARLMENAWYLLASQSLADIAHTIGRFDAEAAWRGRIARMSRAFEELWNPNGGGYRWPTYRGGFDERGNALIVLAGIAPPTHARQLIQTLYSQRNASPYLEFYVLEALYRLGAPDAAMQRMRDRYGPMVTGPAAGPTLWEFWASDKGTTSHGWSSGPLYALSAYAAGVRPIASGYERYEIAPQLGSLDHVRADVPTFHGTITVDVRRLSDGREVLAVHSPPGTTARLTLPGSPSIASSVSINGTPVLSGGRELATPRGAARVAAAADVAVFDLAPGEWTILTTGARELRTSRSRPAQARSARERPN